MTISPSRALARLTKTNEALSKAVAALSVAGYPAALKAVDDALSHHKACCELFDVREQNVRDQLVVVERCQIKLKGLKAVEPTPGVDADIFDTTKALEGHQADLKVLEDQLNEMRLQLGEAKNDYVLKNIELEKIQATPLYKEWKRLEAVAESQKDAHDRKVFSYPHKLARHIRKARSHGFADQKNRTTATVKTAREDFEKLFAELDPKKALELALAGI